MTNPLRLAVRRKTSTADKDKIMAGTRTAPAVTGGATGLLVTIHAIDASGDYFADSIETTVALGTAANIEALVAAYQAATQASVYKVTSASSWEGAALTANAEVDQRSSVKDGINILFKDISAKKTYTPRLIAPVPTVMESNSDIPNLVNLATLTGAYDTILPPNSVLLSAQYTERRERKNNPRVFPE